jgi:hypothetical protein
MTVYILMIVGTVNLSSGPYELEQIIKVYSSQDRCETAKFAAGKSVGQRKLVCRAEKVL